MKHYVIGELKISDDSWVADYTKGVTALIEQHGGRYLARTSAVEKLEGDREVPDILVIIEFPSREAARAVYSSGQYAPYLKARQAGAATQLVLLPAEDVAQGQRGMRSR